METLEKSYIYKNSVNPVIVSLKLIKLKKVVDFIKFKTSLIFISELVMVVFY